MRIACLIPAAAAALVMITAPGCSSLDSGRTVSQKQVMGNIWERSETWPREAEPMPVKEGVTAHATAFCEKQNKNFQPLEGAVTRAVKDKDGKIVRGASATLRFRCTDEVLPND